MSRHEKHILRILGEAREPLVPSEIADRLNGELGGSAYTTAEVIAHLKSLGEQVAELPDGRWVTGATGLWQMKAVALKKDQSQAEAAAFQEMGTLRCDGCGEEFLIRHHPQFVDRKNADKQAHWLEKVLAEEHEREKKHPDRIELPD